VWRIITKETIYGETVPAGLRDDRGFVCQFLAPTYWTGQDARYREECALLRKHAEIMCAALNQEAERLPKE
jgi:hypothetical protein